MMTLSSGYRHDLAHIALNEAPAADPHAARAIANLRRRASHFDIPFETPVVRFRFPHVRRRRITERLFAFTGDFP
jgi:hypothetical protein